MNKLNLMKTSFNMHPSKPVMSFCFKTIMLYLEMKRNIAHTHGIMLHCPLIICILIIISLVEKLPDGSQAMSFIAETIKFSCK